MWFLLQSVILTAHMGTKSWYSLTQWRDVELISYSFGGLLQPHILQSHPQREKQHTENLDTICHFLKAEESNPHHNWYKSKFLSFFSPIWKRHIPRGKKKLFRVVQPVKFGPDTVPEMTGKISSGYLRAPECSESNSVALENEYHRHWKKKKKQKKRLFMMIEYELPNLN